MPELPDVVAPHTARHLQQWLDRHAEGDPQQLRRPSSTPPTARPWPRRGRRSRGRSAILVLAPMYHVNAFATLQQPAHRRPLCRHGEVRRAARPRASSSATGSAPSPRPRRCCSAWPTCPASTQRDLSSLVWITQGAAPMPPSLVHRWAGLIGAERIFMAYGMTEGIGITALRGDDWMRHPGSVGTRHARHRGEDSGPRRTRPPAGPGRRHLPALAVLRRVALPRRRAALAVHRRRVPVPGATSATSTTTVSSTSWTGASTSSSLGAPTCSRPKSRLRSSTTPRSPTWSSSGCATQSGADGCTPSWRPRDPAAPPTADEVIAYAKGRLAAVQGAEDRRVRRRHPAQRSDQGEPRAAVEARGG